MHVARLLSALAVLLGSAEVQEGPRGKCASCSVTIEEPKPYLFLAGDSIDIRVALVVEAAGPVDLYLSVAPGEEWHLWAEDVAPSAVRRTVHQCHFSLEGFSGGAQTITTALLPTSFRQGGFAEGGVLCAASQTFYMVPVPLSPAAWWQGYTLRDTEYMSSLGPLLSLARPPQLSFEPKESFIGITSMPKDAATPPRRKTLVAMFGGLDAQATVDANVRALPASHFSLMLFIYDDSEWTHFPWLSRCVTVRVQRQMKWWYIKRFLGPDVVCGGDYEYVMVVDADVRLPPGTIDTRAYVDVLREYDVRIGQPSHAPESQTTHRILFQDPGIAVGTWTSFVESGTVLTFDVRVWRCVWELLDTDVVVGFGIDQVWGPACAPNNTAVVHSHAIVHENKKVASARLNWMATSAAEGVVVFNRAREAGFFPSDPAVIREFQDSDKIDDQY